MDLDSLTQKSHTLIVFDEKAVVSWAEFVLKEGPVGRSVFVFSSLFCRYCERRDLSIQKPSIPALSKLAKTEKNRGLIRLRLFYPVIFRTYPDIPPALLGYYYKRVTLYKRAMS